MSAPCSTAQDTQTSGALPGRLFNAIPDAITTAIVTLDQAIVEIARSASWITMAPVALAVTVNIMTVSPSP